MGADVRKLVPFGGGVRADMGQTRGAQSGEADRHAVWLAATELEPKLSPFDPMAMLDEIQRLVPAYKVSRLNLLAGNDGTRAGWRSSARERGAIRSCCCRRMTRCSLRARWAVIADPELGDGEPHWQAGRQRKLRRTEALH